MPDAPIDSLDMLFKPEVVSKFADCGVTLLDSPRDVLQFAFAYLHLDPNTTRKEDYDAAEQLLLKIRPYIRGFDSQEYINGLMNKEVCIAMLWSGDYAISQTRARTAHVDIDLAYTVPKEGANAWYDGMMIPKAAPHPEAALKFLNYMMDPQVIAKVSNDIHYANDNAAATPLVDPALVNNPAFYPSGEMEKRLYPMLPDPSPAVERMRTRIWTRIKTGL
jgi:putrescine transport system substrate-binding protein